MRNKEQVRPDCNALRLAAIRIFPLFFYFLFQFFIARV